MFRMDDVDAIIVIVPPWSRLKSPAPLLDVKLLLFSILESADNDKQSVVLFT